MPTLKFLGTLGAVGPPRGCNGDNWPPILNISAQIDIASSNLSVNQRVRGSVYISCRVGGFCPHLLIFQVNNPAPRPIWGVESDSERIYMAGGS